MTNTCIVDVGANNGDFLFPIAARLPSMPIIGIEPIPELVELLQAKADTLNVPNVHLWRSAVDTMPRTAQFHVARHADWGVSSLLEFNTQSVNANEYWSHRKDLYFEDTIDTPVIRLDQALQNAGFDHISFIKIDAQGVDLRVLESLGPLLGKLDGGMLEAPTTLYSSLYNGEPPLLDVLQFLYENDFQAYAIKPNDPACAEVNVFFHRKDIDWRVMEEKLGLRGIPIYDGKHYWHFPSANPHTAIPESDALSMRSEIAWARHVVAENAAAWARVVHWEKQTNSLKAALNTLKAELARSKVGAYLQKNAQPGESSTEPMLDASHGTSHSTAPIERIKEELDRTRREVLQWKAENQALRQTLDAMHASRSWKITAPIRAAKKVFQK